LVILCYYFLPFYCFFPLFQWLEGGMWLEGSNFPSVLASIPSSSSLWLFPRLSKKR
jgi:hypothetical protein